MATVLSRHLSFHARGSAAFVWHGLTGDVAEMSRDVLALLLAFRDGADEKVVAGNPPAGLTAEQVEEFVPVLRSRRFLVQGPDEVGPLLAGVPRVPRTTVFERRADGSVAIYTRAGTPLVLQGRTAELFLRCNGEKTLGQVLGDAGPAVLPELLRLARADVAALKILAKPASQGGVRLNPAAESTMPYPEIEDVADFARGGSPPAAPPDDEPTLASLFAAPHPALRGRTYAQALAAELKRRGAFAGVRGRKARVIELALGPGLGEAFRAALAEHDAELETIDLLQGRRALPNESAQAIVANEIAISLGSTVESSHGALQLVRDAGSALSPSGVLFLADFGDQKAEPIRVGPGYSIRFSELQREATAVGLGARVVPLAEALDMDLNMHGLSTTKASFPALQAFFASHGIELTRRAWLRTEIEDLARARGLDLATVHGLQWAPLIERALGLSPKQFWALVAQKPERVLH